MTTEQLNKIVSDDSALKMLKPSDIEQLIQKYPYWQLAYALRAKYNYLSEIDNAQMLNQSALYAADRSMLKAFVYKANLPENDFFIEFYNDDTIEEKLPDNVTEAFVAEIDIEPIVADTESDDALGIVNVQDEIKTQENIQEKTFLDDFDVEEINLNEEEKSKDETEIPDENFETVTLPENMNFEEEISIEKHTSELENIEKTIMESNFENTDYSEKVISNTIASNVYENEFAIEHKDFAKENFSDKKLTFKAWLQFINQSKSINEAELIQQKIDHHKQNIYDDELDEDDLALQDFVKPLAEKSAQANEIISENYAKILAMQGRNDKAIEVYEKLSLLFPDKKHIFATQIEKLK